MRHAAGVEVRGHYNFLNILYGIRERHKLTSDSHSDHSNLKENMYLSSEIEKSIKCESVKCEDP